MRARKSNEGMVSARPLLAFVAARAHGEIPILEFVLLNREACKLQNTSEKCQGCIYVVVH